MGQEEQGMGGAANMPPFGRESMHRGDESYDPGLDDDEGPPLRARRRAPSGPRERITEGMREIADQIEMAAERLEELADERFSEADGPLARAGDVARGVAGRMDSVARYLRSHDVDGVRRSLERQVREKPVQSILVAVGAGWLAGKILR